jgi:hypothetical protein
MSSALFNGVSNNSFTNSSFLQFVSNFNNFRNNFQGDPKAQVQALLNSGQMTQEQFQQISQMANQLYSIIHN